MLSLKWGILLVIGGFLVWRLGPGFGRVAYGFAFLSAIGAAILLFDIGFRGDAIYACGSAVGFSILGLARNADLLVQRDHGSS